MLAEARRGGLNVSGSIVGKAVQDEEAGQFMVMGPLAIAPHHLASRYPQDHAHGRRQSHRRRCSWVADAGTAWDVIHHAIPRLPRLVQRDALLGIRILTEQSRTLLLDLRARAAAFRVANSKEALVALEQTLNKLVAFLLPDASVLDGVRANASLTDHPIYRGLWNLPAVEPANPKVAPVGDDSQINTQVANAFILQMRTNPAAAKQAAAGGEAASAARRRLMDGLQGAAKEAGLEDRVSGDAKLRDAEGRANAPPVPSAVRAYPALQPPFFDRTAGADHKFVMGLTYPTDLEAVAAHFVNTYTWDLIEIPDGDWSKLEKTADDEKVKGYRPSWGDVLGQKIHREGRYLSADLERVRGATQGIEALLGPMGTGAEGFVAANRALSVIGNVISTFIQIISEPVSEKTIPFKKPGLYVVRCRVYNADASEDASFIRSPAVAWLPVYARKPESMAEDRLELELRSRGSGEARIQEMEKELGDKTLGEKERKALEDELKRIKTSLYGSVADVLDDERTALKKRKKDLLKEAESAGAGRGNELSFELQQIDKRLEELGEILETRTERHKDEVTEGLEGPIRIPASFAGDTGRTLTLALEAIEKPREAEKYRYYVSDATTKDSSAVTGAPLASRGAAIADAVVKLLEKHTGYGRGYVSIHIPPRGGKLAKVDPDTDVRGMMTTLRIEASKEAIAMEGIENITTALSIAAIAAAPFTGGASLAILLPVGAIGAIPSAYRLADRGASGTLRMDLGAAMDLVNVIGGVAGLGQVGAVARYTRVSGALLVAGHGADGLGMILAGAQFIEAASNIDPNAPPGVRRAMLMELVGQQLMTLGMMVGTSLARRGEAIRAKQGGAGGDAHLDLKRAPADLHEKFKTQAGTDAPIFEDPNLKGNSVDVRYDIDGYGLVRDVRVMMASGADPEVVLKHAGTVKTLRRFSGLQGLLRNLLDRITTLIGRDKAKVGSKAWAAKLELEKLPDIMRHYQEQVATGKMSAAEAEAKIADLEQKSRSTRPPSATSTWPVPARSRWATQTPTRRRPATPRWRVTTMCATPAGSSSSSSYPEATPSPRR